MRDGAPPPANFSHPREVCWPYIMVRAVVAFLVVSATLTTYFAYCNFSRLNRFSDDERQAYDDL